MRTIAFGLHDLAQRDTDADLRTDQVAQCLIVRAVRGLKRQRYADGVGCTGELGHLRVAAKLMGYTAVHGYGLGQPTKHVLEPLMGDTFIHLDERGRSNDVGVQNDSEL
ncbi:MAG: hypothetical protein KDK91_19030 [Gammaproteobacteria bacterium]|nr:hypothetical protein [Gammaproteobacteria bacterium]